MSYIFKTFTSFSGDISRWEVARVTDMTEMFSSTKFDGDISKWNMAKLSDMSGMFSHTTLFNGDISRWDVSSVKDTSRMFYVATAFDGDISKWDVSSVINMDNMFNGATSFKQQLCGTAWTNTQATQVDMFVGSHGAIAQTMCHTSPPQRWLARWQMATSAITIPAIASRIKICPICATFKKTGVVSCCAPGGAWFKRCAGSRRRHVGHTWLDGIEACKRKCKIDGVRSMLAHTIKSALIAVSSTHSNHSPHVNMSSDDNDHHFCMPPMRHRSKIRQK